MLNLIAAILRNTVELLIKELRTSNSKFGLVETPRKFIILLLFTWC